ncbi:hypothetical protein CLV30_1157 [Haloactinopolyspora alba]|uniref:Catalytic LigB subunit of aromatic ring-opening dioxygenase n=1 Tax=Haloactinopolyspora alba TaxID=648780 RepID=A0A2P8DV39_9ACTN|nr:hypothetical protein [Haloactinopolyspora alba]PSL01072.1 hypothetical protein CLV30_1157 [Haloactinopolyspora alba]
MLVSAAVCPHPPLLVAGVGPARDDDIDLLRGACWTALDALRDGSPELLVVVGVGPDTADEVTGGGSLADYGVDRRVALPGAHAGDDGLPLSLCVAAWLLERDGWSGSVTGASVAPSAAADDCARLGERLAWRRERVAMLVMADGSAQRSDEQADADRALARRHDADLVRALESGDPRAILALDDAAAAASRAGGIPPLRVLGGAAEDGLFDAEMLYDAAPFGVGYSVVVWERHG